MAEVSTDGVRPVETEMAGAVITVRLARPAQANSLTLAAKEALLTELQRAAGEKAIRAVVLTGSGRSFCAGQDLVEHAQALEADPATAFRTVEAHYSPIVRLLATMPKPVVAAVNGSCAGAGLGFALACDLRVAAEGARLVPGFTGIGLTADSGLSATLARAVGWSRAMAILMLGEVVEAEQALRIGLVHEVVAADRFEDRVRDLAERLASGPTQAFAALKEAMWASASAPLAEVLAMEGRLQERLAGTADHQAAVKAFLEKNQPEFGGS